MSNMKVTLLRHTEDGEELIAMAAKLCYSDASQEDIANIVQSEGETQRFIRMLSDLGHKSPMEHSSYTFGIENISRITEVQLVRKRIASYSVKSGRYVKRDNPGFIMPPAIAESELASEIFHNVEEASVQAYNQIFLILMLRQMGIEEESIRKMPTDGRILTIETLKNIDRKKYAQMEKKAIEDARYAHLQSLPTSLIVTMNGSALREFFTARMCRRAQWEIREMATKMLEEVRKVSPILFADAGANCVRGGCTEGKMTCGNPYPRFIAKKVK